MVRRIVEEKWSGRKVLQEVVTPSAPISSLREVSQTTVEQRFEKRVLDAAKTIHSLLSLPQENYEEVVITLALRAKDHKTRQALQALRQTLEEILLKVEDLTALEVIEVSLLAILPPLEGLKRHLTPEKAQLLETQTLTGGQILEQLLTWRHDDVVAASRLEPFFNQVEFDAEALRAGEPLPLPRLKGQKHPVYSDLVVYKVEAGVSIYWAHELLVRRGEAQFKSMKAELISMTTLDE